MKNVVYLGLGSNIGNRGENINSALSFLQSSGFAEINKISDFYETSPVGPKQRNFYNIAVKAATSLNPRDLLFFVKRAEEILGRKPSKRLTKRLIDIDILFYNGSVCHYFTPPLTIPHKEICRRLFVLTPLAQIAPDFTHPVLNRKIKHILKRRLLTPGNQKVKIIGK